LRLRFVFTSRQWRPFRALPRLLRTALARAAARLLWLLLWLSTTSLLLPLLRLLLARSALGCSGTAPVSRAAVT
jgi:hypothetical protein